MRTRLAAAALAGLLPLTACASAAVAPPAAAPAGPAAASGQKVNANTASQAELTAAFEAAGVSNAARWAHEVEEYRPYAAGDPQMADLREELAKYQPGEGVVDAIVSALTV